MPATNPARHALGAWPAATLAALAIALTGLAGCGDDDSSSDTTAAQPPPARGAADPTVVKRIPLESTTGQVVAQIGRPARIQRVPSPKAKKGAPRPPAQTCYIYRVTGGRSNEQIKMCFVAGKLLSVLAVTAKK